MNEAIWIIILVAIATISLSFSLARRKTPPAVPGLSVRYTAHAKERMLQRTVSQEQIEQVLFGPERTTPDAEQGSIRLERDFPAARAGDRDTLKVWVVAPWPAPAEIVVKTTAWTYLAEVRIPAGAEKQIIGTKGARVRRLQDQTGTRISVSPGIATISANDPRSRDLARKEIARWGDEIRAAA